MSKRLLHTPEGVRDIYGDEYKRKLKVESLLREKIDDFGYDEIQTPTFEFFDIFSKEIGTTPSKELYKFFDKEGDTLVLRPDFTPSIARCAAKYFLESEEVLRLSYAGNAFTNNSLLQGKLKESMQMGAELIGDASVQADAEVIALTCEALFHAGLSDFLISVGNVAFFKGMCTKAGLDEETELELREYISGKNFFAAEDLLDARSVDKQTSEKLLSVSELFGQADVLDRALEISDNDQSREAIIRLKNLVEVLKLYEVEKYISFDLGMLSKYNYYTGVIFKGFTYGVGDAIVKGGRYDKLLGRFGKDAPAVGFVILVDDLLNAMSRQGIPVHIDDEVVTMEYDDESYEKVLKEALKLRHVGGTKVRLIRK
ncbi:MAG: ATP phosphoribosyltransferase regulatory subunit [Lachnospiraceae bacterium]|nr:ATP phosphoribosyltransferase regulatory subunit [Lachnospiraceae bacterium]